MMIKMQDPESKLSAYSLQISTYINQLKGQRDEIKVLVDKQKTEKADLEAQLEKIVYKLKTLDKSISQRLTALDNYEVRITDAEEKYSKIVQRSESLLTLVKHDLHELESIMNKKIGTNTNDVEQQPQ